MKHVPKSQAKKVDIGAGDVLEYQLDDPDIDGAVVTVNGKYPKSGYVVNEECKELLYVLSGSGSLITKTGSAELGPGDEALIDKGELFRYENCNNLVLLAVCTPRWRAEQHQEVND